MALFFLLLILPTVSLAEVNITSYPYANDLDMASDMTNLNDNLDTGNGAAHAHVSSGGFDDRGFVRITPPTTDYDGNCCPSGCTNDNGGYAGLGGFRLDTPQDVIYIRFLYRLSPNWMTGNNPTDCGLNPEVKAAIFNPDISEGDERSEGRAMLGFHFYDCDDNTDHYRWAAGDNLATAYQQNCEFSVTDYLDQWVCIEFAASNSGDWSRLWITTRDGAFVADEGSPDADLNTTHAGSNWTDVEGLGFWFFNGAFPESNTYVDIDEIAISTSYIGPPDGFVSRGDHAIISTLLLLLSP